MLSRLLAAARSREAVRLMRQGWAALDRLPYPHVLCLDTEFRTQGDPHRGWCLCGVELRNGREFKLWLDGCLVVPPFPLDDSTLFVAFVAGADVATLRVYGWSMPARIFDLFQEFRLVSNTGQRSDPHSLEEAAVYYGITMMDHAAKKHMQQEAQERTVWPPELQQQLVDYCFKDALATARVFLCVLAQWLEIHAGQEEVALHHALRRGRFAAVMAETELRGIPFSMPDWVTLRDGRETVFEAMVNDLHPVLRPIYRNSPDGPVQDVRIFTQVMGSLGLTEDWPLTPSGLLSTNKNVLAGMLQIPPHLKHLAEARNLSSDDLSYLGEVMKVRSRFALLQYQVGADGRARCPFFPGSTATGRNVPKAAQFIYNAPALFRHLIQTRPGWVVIAFDYRAEESALVGGMADCGLLLNIYAAEDDVHLGCAKRAELVPMDATAASHKVERKAFKACNLGVVYGAQVPRIAITAGITPGKAQQFYDLHRAMFTEVHEFCERVIAHTREARLLVLQDGWRTRTVPPFKPTRAANAPIQGTGGGILRRAVLGCHEASLPLIATVHDSLVFEVRIEDAEALIRAVVRIMGDASEWFVPGLRLKVDVAASVALSHLAHLDIGPLAAPATRAGYERHLARAARSKAAAA
jgi:DNA polymerase I-like protein with 3'-5' exonuclease and polymerase domains